MHVCHDTLLSLTPEGHMSMYAVGDLRGEAIPLVIKITRKHPPCKPFIGRGTIYGHLRRNPK